MSIVYNEKCTGCTACLATCSKDAISMQSDIEGFFFPVIDNDKCIKCEKCTRVCPINNTQKHQFQDILYAASNANEEERSFSASGGVFPIFAKFFLSMGGFVCGCIIDENFSVKHVLSNNKDVIHGMSKSKYVQSDMGSCFRQIRKALKEKKYVFFTGTPCQVSGLNNFLGHKYYNLFTMDFSCHGVPSPLVLQLYLDDAKRKFPSLKKIWFRNKQHGWDRSVAMTYLDNNDKVLSYRFVPNDSYMTMFTGNHCLRKCCGICEYTTPERVSDITVGDFWSINRWAPVLNDNKGLSFIKINTQKGNNLLQKLANNFNILNKLPFNTIQNNMFLRPLPTGRRGELFENLRNTSNFMNWVDNNFSNQTNYQYADAVTALIDSNMLSLDVNSGNIDINLHQLTKFVSNNVFDESLGEESILFHAGKQLLYNTSQNNNCAISFITNDKKKFISFRLLIAEANRIIKKSVVERLHHNKEYLTSPSLLIPLIQQTIRDRHQAYLLREVERLAGKDVYFFGCGELYKMKRNLFAKLNPRCILVDYDCEPSAAMDGLAICKAAEILPRGEILPIVIFSGKAGIIAQRLRQQYPDYMDIITCVML